MTNIFSLFGGLALLYSSLMAFSTFDETHALLRMLNSKNATVILFFIAGFFFLPFVITLTQLGLNGDQGKSLVEGESSLESKERHKQLAEHCPTWQYVWKGSITSIGVIMIAFTLFGNRIDPACAFFSAISFLSGYWFVFVYPTARKLFG
ncbi:hypothetical protein [Gimesia maris]|uniref:hypothetical protein n=1 Tax=Gimesia maris TaxID=122 RepID=UPI0032ED91BC